MVRGALWATVHGAAKESDATKRLTFHFFQTTSRNLPLQQSLKCRRIYVCPSIKVFIKTVCVKALEDLTLYFCNLKFKLNAAPDSPSWLVSR